MFGEVPPGRSRIGRTGDSHPPSFLFISQSGHMSNFRDTSLREIPGLAALGLMATGLIGLLHAILTGEGLGLIASAIAFGVVFHVAVR